MILRIIIFLLYAQCCFCKSIVDEVIQDTEIDVVVKYVNLKINYDVEDSSRKLENSKSKRNIFDNPLRTIKDKVSDINPIPQLEKVFTSVKDTVVENNPLKNVTIGSINPIPVVEKTFTGIKDVLVENNPLKNVTVDSINPIPVVEKTLADIKDAAVENNPFQSVVNATLEMANFESITNIIYGGLIAYEETNIEVPLLKETIQRLSIPNHMFRRKIVNPLVKSAICVTSVAVSKYFIARSRLNLSRNRLIDVLVFACSILNVESEEVCRGVLELNIDILIYIAKEKQDLNAFKLSSIVFQRFGCFKGYRPKWSIELPEGESLQRPNIENNDFYRVLQITDLHMDPLYKVGTSTVCDEPLCCQNDQPQAENREDGAAEWSDYNHCDMPYTALDDLLNQVLKHNNNLNPKFTYLYFTGDIISHRVWDTSRQSNTGEIKRVYDLFKEKFNGLQIYPILGNHEPHPLNVFSHLNITNEYSTSWLFDLIAEEWSPWLPAEALSTIRQGGYYTVLVKPGFRIIALNSNVCYIFNWWLLYDDRDQYGQLEWLTRVLKAAENANESVHILSHVPPGDPECLQEWTRQYGLIVERFSNTITGQFNGHTHYDEFRTFFKNKTEVIGVAYNGGSFTTYENLNPNYRIYEVDSKSHDLLDFEQWTYDLEEANRNSTPNWYKLYNFKSAYNVTSLKPKEIQGLLLRMKDDFKILQDYYKFKVRNARPSLIEGCEKDCQKENLCSIVSSEADEAAKCSDSLNLIPS